MLDGLVRRLPSPDEAQVEDEEARHQQAKDCEHRRTFVFLL
jgi:hypothetical protein